MNNDLRVVLDNEQASSLHNYIYTLVLNSIDEAKRATAINKKWLRKNEACKYAGVSFNTFNKWCNAGLPTHTIEGTMLFDKNDIDCWIGNNGSMTN